MLKQRLRFVVEIDPRLLPPFFERNEIYDCAHSEGFNKALVVPSRVLQLIYSLGSLEGFDRVAFEADRSAWGSHLVKGTTEYNNLFRTLKQATLVSFKIYPNNLGVGVRANFRRHREELGYLETTFTQAGQHVGGTNNMQI